MIITIILKCLPLTCAFNLTCTVYDCLSVHLPRTECGEELWRNCVLPVLTVAHLLLQRRSVWQQGQRWVYTPAESRTHSVAENRWMGTDGEIKWNKHFFYTNIAITKKEISQTLWGNLKLKVFKSFACGSQPSSFPGRQLLNHWSSIINHLWGGLGDSPASRPRGVWGCRVL